MKGEIVISEALVRKIVSTFSHRLRRFFSFSHPRNFLSLRERKKTKRSEVPQHRECWATSFSADENLTHIFHENKSPVKTFIMSWVKKEFSDVFLIQTCYFSFPDHHKIVKFSLNFPSTSMFFGGWKFSTLITSFTFENFLTFHFARSIFHFSTLLFITWRHILYITDFTYSPFCKWFAWKACWNIACMMALEFSFVSFEKLSWCRWKRGKFID